MARFGVFEADLSAGVLTRRGREIRLQAQPFQILALLLQHPGEMVTRRALQEAVWPADTFVEFDHGVNTAIKKIRRALGDSAENPRFVETLPRRGYRFIAPVNESVEASRRWIAASVALLLATARTSAVLLGLIR